MSYEPDTRLPPGWSVEGLYRSMTSAVVLRDLGVPAALPLLVTVENHGGPYRTFRVAIPSRLAPVYDVVARTLPLREGLAMLGALVQTFGVAGLALIHRQGGEEALRAVRLASAGALLEAVARSGRSVRC